MILVLSLVLHALTILFVQLASPHITSSQTDVFPVVLLVTTQTTHLFVKVVLPTVKVAHH